jgi:hypothetical protein
MFQQPGSGLAVLGVREAAMGSACSPDLLRYRLSGNPRLTGEQLIEPLPEIAKVARVDVDKTTSWGQGSYEDLRKLSLRIEEILQSPDIDGAVYVQAPTRSRRPPTS